MLQFHAVFNSRGGNAKERAARRMHAITRFYLANSPSYLLIFDIGLGVLLCPVLLQMPNRKRGGHLNRQCSAAHRKSRAKMSPRRRLWGTVCAIGDVGRQLALLYVRPPLSCTTYALRTPFLFMWCGVPFLPVHKWAVRTHSVCLSGGREGLNREGGNK